MRRLLLLLANLLMCLVLVLAWTLGRRGEAEAVPDSPRHVASEVEPAIEGADEPLAGFDAEADAEAAPLGSDRVGLSPSSGTEEGVEEPAGRSVRVLVVDRESGVPVAGARVRSAPLHVLIEKRQHASTPDPEDELDLFGVETATDAGGEATILVSTRAVIVDARAADRWGHRRIVESTEVPVVIELFRDRSVAIRTVDLGGRPLAEVPVALRSQRGRDGARDVWTNRTRGEEALARVPHLDALLAERGSSGDLTVGLAFPTRVPSSVMLDLDDLPRAPVELVVPATGSLAVRVERPDGRPAEHASVRIALAVDAAPDAIASADATGRRRPREVFSSPVPAVAGSVAEPFVEIGLELVVEASSDEGWKPVRVRTAGPRHAGEVVEIVLRFADSFPRLTGRLVDAGGVALVRRDVRAKVLDRDAAPGGAVARPLGRFWTTTRDDGSFEIRLDPVPPAHADEVELAVLDDVRSPSVLARVALPPELVAGEIALGDVVVRAAPVLLGGQVVDETGAPVPAASLSVERETPAAGGRDENGWRRDSELNGRTDAEGRFALHGDPGSGALRVSASRDGFARAEPVLASAGERGLKLFLEHAGEIAGRIEVERGVAPSLLAIRVRSTPEPGREAKVRRASVARDGTFRVESISPGVYDLALLFGADPLPIAEVSGIPVLGRETTRDPRVDPLDLRGEVEFVRVDAVDTARRPVVPGKVFATTQGSSRPSTAAFDLVRGRALVPLHGKSADLAVRAPGYREVRLAGVEEDLVVELEPALVVRLTLPPGVRVPDAPLRLSAVLTLSEKTDVGATSPARGRAAAERGRRGAQPSAVFDATGEARLELSAVGTYSVRFELRAGRERRPPLAGVPASIEVEELVGEQVFTVAPESDAYDEATRAPR